MDNMLLELFYNEKHHQGMSRMMKELVSFSFKGITRKVKAHLTACHGCAFGQTDCQQKGAYKLNSPPFLLMEVIKIDSTTHMPRASSAGSPWTLEGFTTLDQLMTVTCQTSQRCILVPGEQTYTAAQSAQ